jgi:hypothetical protein
MQNYKRFFLISILSWVVFGLCPESQARTEGSPPEINFAWAQDKIRQGDDWRIYVSATDPDRDMVKIYCRMNSYRPDITLIKKEMEGQLNGYLVLRTNSLRNLFGLSLTLILIIADRAGNESKPVVFPLTIDGEPMKPLPADRVSPSLEKDLNKRIGYIGIDLTRWSGN